jgi:hypothetical protein
VTKGFLADSESPVQPMGVNPGETLGVIFDLQPALTYDGVIAAMELSLANPGFDMDGGLRIGIKAQGFEGGGSEAFVNGPGSLPEPASVAVWTLLTLATGGVGCCRSRTGLLWSR